MIIDKRSYFGSDPKEIQHLQKKLLPIMKEDKQIATPLYMSMEALLGDLSVPLFLLTKPVQEICSKIKVTNKTIGLLNSSFKEYENGMLLLGDSFIRYLYVKDRLFCLYCYLQKAPDGHKYIHYSSFWLSLANPDSNDAEYVAMEHTQLVMQALIFFKAGDLDVKLIESGKKVGTKRDGYVNLTSNHIKVINSGWNRITINTAGFEVSGHLRLQRCGEKWKDLRLVWINPYQKEGYTRVGGGVKE